MPREPRHKMSDYRARLRAAGLRPVQIWVANIDAPGLAAEAKRQSRLAARRTSEREAIGFIEAAFDADGGS